MSRMKCLQRTPRNLQYAGRSLQAFNEALTELKGENERLSKELVSIRKAYNESQDVDEMTMKNKATTVNSVQTQVYAILKKTKNVTRPATEADWEELADAFKACRAMRLLKRFPITAAHCGRCLTYHISSYNVISHVISKRHKKKAAASTSRDAVIFWINACKNSK